MEDYKDMDEDLSVYEIGKKYYEYREQLSAEQLVAADNLFGRTIHYLDSLVLTLPKVTDLPYQKRDSLTLVLENISIPQ